MRNKVKSFREIENVMGAMIRVQDAETTAGTSTFISQVYYKLTKSNGRHIEILLTNTTYSLCNVQGFCETQNLYLAPVPPCLAHM